MVTYIKGGVWTNVEDEILRAAVAKYGLNQWARVSSLLVRKTAKQVKARWTEWLDPAIKKVEWSREEDEKLLHLAKVMPTQWRSIAPLVGRTANQCIERYQKLLDDAERREQRTDLSLSGVGDEANAPAASSSRTYRLGDIDPNPETRPARPDAVDMDEDEKEMLSEARARLANTKGKKAKRKDRERLLEESRRLTLLQKRRELKQAGINTKLKQKMKGSINYNNDIPFEHKPAPGFYDTAEEKEANERARAKYDALLEKKGIQGSRRDGQKDGSKRDRNDSNGTAAQQAAAARAEKLLQITESEQRAKRRKLVLPEPQVRDDELEQIIKHAKRGDEAKLLNEADSSTSGLVGEYGEILPERALNGVDETPLADDRIRQAMTDLKSLTGAQSSLLGQENTPLNDDSFRRGSMFPPPVAAQRNAVMNHVEQTPRRDALGVNITGVEVTPKSQLRRAFASLPKPRNDFEIAIPEEKIPVEQEEQETLLDDAGERERRLAAEKERQKQLMLERRSQALKRGLPRPPNQLITDLKSKMSNTNDPVQELILNEMKALLVSDSTKWPSAASSINGHGKETAFVLTDLTDEERVQALEEIQQEAGEFDASTTTAVSREPLAMDSKLLMNVLTNFAQKSNKQEQKLGLVLGGYMKRQSVLSDKLVQAFNALEEIQSRRVAFEHLRDMEEIALSSRLSRLQEEVNFLVDAERRGQERYRELKSDLN